MKLTESLKLAAVWAACAGMMSPVATFGAVPGEDSARTSQSASKVVIRDVALTTGGTLAGQVVDTHGRGLAGLPVTIHRQGNAARQTTTDGQGLFSVTNLDGGVYEVIAAQQVSHYRVWTSAAAPPSATAGMLLVANGEAVVRGQYAPQGVPAVPQGVYGGEVVNGCGPAGDCNYGACGPPVAGPVKGFHWLANPWIVGAAIAAGIAIPLALDNDDAS